MKRDAARALAAACAAALRDPEAGEARLRALLGDCAAGLEGLAEEGEGLRAGARRQIEEIARLIEAEAVAWPEDVARLRTLAARIRACPPL